MRCERCREEAVVDRNDKSPGTCKSLAAAHVATWPSVAAAAVNESITSTKVVNSHLLPANTSATAQQQIRVMSGKQLLDQQRNLLLLLTETLSTLARYGHKHTFFPAQQAFSKNVHVVEIKSVK